MLPPWHSSDVSLSSKERHNTHKIQLPPPTLHHFPSPELSQSWNIPTIIFKGGNVHVLFYLEVLILLHTLIQTASNYDLKVRQRWSCTYTVKFIGHSLNKYTHWAPTRNHFCAVNTWPLMQAYAKMHDIKYEWSLGCVCTGRRKWGQGQKRWSWKGKWQPDHDGPVRPNQI